MNQRDQSPLIHLAWRDPQVDITHSSSNLSVSVCLSSSVFAHYSQGVCLVFCCCFFSFCRVCPSVVMRSVANCVCRRSVFCSIHGGHLGWCSVPRQTQAHGQVWVSCFSHLHRCYSVFSGAPVSKSSGFLQESREASSSSHLLTFN